MFDFSPQLTWRDIQHLTVLTSKRNSLFDAKGRFHWTMNGVGLEFNHLFGYGVLDAGAMVALAKKWKTVPPRYHCEAGSVLETQWVYFHSSTIQSQEFATQEQRNTTSSFLSFHELRITCKIENLNAYQITIGGWDRLYRSSPIPFSFYLIFDGTIHFSSLSPYVCRPRTNIFPSTFLEKFTVHSSLFRKANKHTTPIFLFQGSDKRSIDLAEDKDWCLCGDRVRCQLSGTRAGRHFRERYAAWRFGTVSNLPYGYQVINFIETFQFRIDLLYQIILRTNFFFSDRWFWAGE